MYSETKTTKLNKDKHEHAAMWQVGMKTDTYGKVTNHKFALEDFKC